MLGCSPAHVICVKLPAIPGRRSFALRARFPDLGHRRTFSLSLSHCALLKSSSALQPHPTRSTLYNNTNKEISIFRENTQILLRVLSPNKITKKTKPRRPTKINLGHRQKNHACQKKTSPTDKNQTAATKKEQISATNKNQTSATEKIQTSATERNQSSATTAHPFIQNQNLSCLGVESTTASASILATSSPPLTRVCSALPPLNSWSILNARSVSPTRTSEHIAAHTKACPAN